jgi:hypothetical protein
VARTTQSVNEGEKMGTFKIQFALVALVGGFGFSACNNTAFTATAPGAGIQPLIEPINPPPSGGVGNTNPPGCTIGTATKPIRVMFMVDNSGSTNTTDPKQAIRVQTLQKFLTDYGANTNLSYNFAYFAGTTAKAFNMVTNMFVTGTTANAVGNSSQLATALQNYEAVAANGSTPYKAAFDSLTGTIAADETAGNKQDYAVVFLSDGQPTDITGIANLKGLVDNVKSASMVNGSAVTVNTIYFGDDTDQTSKDNLLAMSTEGAGQFVDTNKLTAGGLVINNVINVPGTNCK